MAKRWLALVGTILFVAIAAGCEPLLVLDPKGPQAARQAGDIKLTIFLMLFVVVVVFAMLAWFLFKYRASRQPADYEPPHIEGNKYVEGLIVFFPVVIILVLSVISVRSNYIVEAAPQNVDNKEPLVIYASSSNWKWHFSYPEEGIETVNYLYVPTDRALEFKLYSYGPITSFWIPQLGGQKYAMADMVTTLHLAAEVPGEYMGRNANFSGRGFARNTFSVKAVSPAEFDEWVEEVKETAPLLTEEKFAELLEPGHLGQLTFTGTHLSFMPPPEHEHADGDGHSDSLDGQHDAHHDEHHDEHHH